MRKSDVSLPLDCDQAFSLYENCRGRLPKAAFPASSERAANLDEIADAFDVFILDAFGVLNIGQSRVPGAPQRIAGLKARGKRMIVMTNGASFNERFAQEKYQGLGYDFALADIISSRSVLADEPALEDPAFQWGVAAIPQANLPEFGPNFHALDSDQTSHDRADGLILLSGNAWNLELHDIMLRSLRNNPRPLYVGNPDIVAPHEDRFTIEPGFYAHDIAERTGIEPVFCGKPFANAFDAVKARLSQENNTTPPERIAMVGDTLHTDILGGAAAGFRTVFVEEHGLFRGRDTAAFIEQSGIVPDFIVQTT